MEREEVMPETIAGPAVASNTTGDVGIILSRY